ncbi:prephenate dehydratase [Streptomyces collinus]|uniref:prephenate dehydratase n=1 Tax=Streptomyces collinus TaxID=42684 RepID=UPI0036A9FD63
MTPQERAHGPAAALPERATRSPYRYAFLGPEGSFTHEALLTLPGIASAQLLPMATVPRALDAVRYRYADAAMVPCESTVAGPVLETVEQLNNPDSLFTATQEVVLPITFSLLVRPRQKIEDIRTIASHPHSLPQTQHWLTTHLPHAQWHPAASNSDAARRVAAGEYDAALAGTSAATWWGLQNLATGIQDARHAETRFLLVALL